MKFARHLFQRSVAVASIDSSADRGLEPDMLCRVVPLLLTAALLSPLIAGASDGDEGNRGGRLTIDSALPDKEIRCKLLQHTPPGTSGVEVLSFVFDKLRPSRPVNAYSRYDKAYEASTGKKSGATPIASREISVTATERLVSLLTSEQVKARWHFDENDQLTDIKVERVAIGP